jgi:hypothetical protein
VPLHLRGREFISRNANHLHVSEFQALIKGHLQGLVPSGIEVSILPHHTSIKSLQVAIKQPLLFLKSFLLLRI